MKGLGSGAWFRAHEAISSSLQLSSEVQEMTHACQGQRAKEPAQGPWCGGRESGEFMGSKPRLGSGSTHHTSWRAWCSHLPTRPLMKQVKQQQRARERDQPTHSRGYVWPGPRSEIGALTRPRGWRARAQVGGQGGIRESLVLGERRGGEG